MSVGNSAAAAAFAPASALASATASTVAGGLLVSRSTTNEICRMRRSHMIRTIEFRTRCRTPNTRAVNAGNMGCAALLQ